MPICFPEDCPEACDEHKYTLKHLLDQFKEDTAVEKARIAKLEVDAQPKPYPHHRPTMLQEDKMQYIHMLRGSEFDAKFMRWCQTQALG